ncbi:hypothetical protein HXZ77_02155 [Acinetobacter johnsonii]|uniref:hypothetical protein n=1 Tax=Acinetobacter johnsonii TaxID=40214 RepID=UPI0025787FD8|nr:hypothetical protein [Acinetobacter johnsonii]MDM1249958.1 hypothetical protein [Acinetobacter johnsonii]
MSLTDIQRAELYLSEIYFQTIKEFELHELAITSNFFTEENFLRLVNCLKRFESNKLTGKHSKLYELVSEGSELMRAMKNGQESFSELDMKEFMDEYLQLDSNYIKSINIELLKQPFDLETKTYKKYLKFKKEQLFLELINTIYTKQPTSWKSDLNAVEVNYNCYMAEFKKFDIEWIENEINQKENYLPKIKSKFVKKVQGWVVANKLEKFKDLVLKPRIEITPDEKKIKSETIKTEKEIVLLGRLLDSLKSPLPDQDFIRKYLPYYGEGTERMLRSLLSNNKELINQIINNE